MNRFLIAAGIGAGLIVAQTAASAAAGGLILSGPAEVSVAPAASAGRTTATMDRVTAGAASYDLTMVDGLGVPGQQAVQTNQTTQPQGQPQGSLEVTGSVQVEEETSIERPGQTDGPDPHMGGYSGMGGGLSGAGAGGGAVGGGLGGGGRALLGAAVAIGVAAVLTNDSDASPANP